MLAAQSPLSGHQIHRPKTARKPLQPKNSPATPINTNLESKQDARQWFEITVIDDSNKENIAHPLYATPAKTDSFKIEQLDASLAEELSVIRQKLERLRLEKEKTEKLLSEREMVLDMQMKELHMKGEEQKQLEIEVDRLFRLKELRLSCMRILPIRSLREKVNPKKTEEDQLQERSSIGIEESKDESL